MQQDEGTYDQHMETFRAKIKEARAALADHGMTPETTPPTKWPDHVWALVYDASKASAAAQLADPDRHAEFAIGILHQYQQLRAQQAQNN